MEKTGPTGKDRVRNATPDSINEEIDKQTEADLRAYTYADKTTIKHHLRKLDEEWDIERALELNASIVAFTGVVLGATVHRRWLILPVIVTAFLAQHALQGWCPPVPILRKLRFRTQKEIQAERHGLLKVLERE